jgi:uncharacterized protein YqjF (DUF2071 family)
VAWELLLPEPVVAPVLRQRWSHTGFVHWAYPPEAVRRVLPEGLELDTLDGSAWVSLVMFRAERTRLPRLPPVPFLSTFTEINLRTYLTAPGDRPGLWFFSLEAPQPALVIGARVMGGIPYQAARTALRLRDGIVEYESRRVLGTPASLAVQVRTGEAYRDEELRELDHFLTARWGAYSVLGDDFRYTPVEHELWPLHHAELVALEQTLTDAAGLPTPGGEPLVHYAPTVDATLGVHREVGTH